MSEQWIDLEKWNKPEPIPILPIITISVHGVITFTKDFLKFAKDQVSDNQYVELNYSKKNEAIVFNFVNIKENNFELSTGRTMGISANIFFKKCQIDGQGKYIAKLEDIPNLGNVWVIYLKDKKND